MIKTVVVLKKSRLYRFSEDKSNWSSWTAYGDTLDSSPFEWDYTAAEGDGYYEFKINVTDIAGNEVESEVFPVSRYLVPNNPYTGHDRPCNRSLANQCGHLYQMEKTKVTKVSSLFFFSYLF